MPIKFCSTCRKEVEIDADKKTCEPCRERGALNRKLARSKVVLCKHLKEKNKKCTNKVSKKCGNLFCEKHIRQWLMYKDKKKAGSSIKYCNSRTQCDPDNPGVKAKLPENYDKKKCENCLNHERKTDKERRHAKRKQSKILNKDSMYACLKCAFDIKHIRDEMGVKSDGRLSNLCKKHFEAQQKIEENRPERYRLDEYKKSDNRPDRKFHKYRKNAYMRNISFKIEFDLFEKMIKDKCYYCGEDPGEFTNGIDRVNNDIGYEINNIVTACSMCNKLKRIKNESTFILTAVHIAHYNNLFAGQLYPHVFNDYYSTGKVSYNIYLKGAKERGYEFKLTEDNFRDIIKGNCHICGRQPSNTHKNGIDRVDNSIGYTIENSKACCGDCNTAKGKYKLNDILEKYAKIAEFNKKRLKLLEKNWTKSKIRTGRPKLIVPDDLDMLQIPNSDIDDIDIDSIVFLDDDRHIKPKKYTKSLAAKFMDKELENLDETNDIFIASVVKNKKNYLEM